MTEEKRSLTPSDGARAALILSQAVLRRWAELYAHLQNECGEVVSRKLDYNLPPGDHVRALEAIDEALRMPSETKEHTEYLRQLLIGLECNNIDKLLTEKQDPLLFRYLAERIACAAKAGAALGAGIAPEEP